MANVVAIALHKARTSTHRHDNHPVEVGLITGSKAVGYELLGLSRGQTVDRFVDISRPDTRNHHLLNVLQVDLIVKQILTEATVE